jgi:hypothetical protein
MPHDPNTVQGQPRRQTQRLRVVQNDYISRSDHRHDIGKSKSQCFSVHVSTCAGSQQIGGGATSVQQVMDIFGEGIEVGATPYHSPAEVVPPTIGAEYDGANEFSDTAAVGTCVDVHYPGCATVYWFGDPFNGYFSTVQCPVLSVEGAPPTP